jgi:hypothetical protein
MTYLGMASDFWGWTAISDYVDKPEEDEDRDVDEVMA